MFAKPQVPFASDRIRGETGLLHFEGRHAGADVYLLRKKALKRDGKTPALMIAYGGFCESDANWNPEYAWWIEQGGFFAQPNLRGGGEYGEDWHKAGMFEKKQNVFDDFFAAAQYLIDEQIHDIRRDLRFAVAPMVAC